MAKAVKRIELAQYRLADGGQSVAVFEALEHTTTHEMPDGMVWIRRLRLVIGVNWLEVPEGVTDIGDILHADKLVRVIYTDDTLSEWVILTVTYAADGSSIVITGRGIIEDLHRRVELLTEDVGGRPSYAITKRDTVANQFSFALGFARSYFALGTITPSATVEVTANAANPLAWCVATVIAVAKLVGVSYEIWEEWDAGTSKFKVYCGIKNAAAPIPDLIFNKNLDSLEVTEDGQPRASRVQTLDPSNHGMDDNAWEVVALSANTWVEYEGINGLAHPMIEDFVLDDFSVVDRLNGIHAIGVSTIISAVRFRVTVTSTTNISVGDWNRIVRDASGNGLRYLRKPSSEAIWQEAHVTLRRDTPAHTNHIRNADLAAGLAGWSVTGTSPTLTTTPGLFKTGGQSARLNAAGSSFYQPRTIYMAAGEWLTYWIQILIASYSDTSGVVRFVHPETGANDEYFLDGSVAGLDQKNVWLTFARSYQAINPGAKNCTLLLASGAGPGDKYLDAASMTLTPAAVPFVSGSGGAQHMVDAVAYMREFAERAVTVQGTFSDLTRAFPDFYPDDEIVEGGTVRITSPQKFLAPAITPRLIKLVRDEKHPTRSAGVWSTRRRTLTGAIA